MNSTENIGYTTLKAIYFSTDIIFFLDFFFKSWVTESMDMDIGGASWTTQGEHMQDLLDALSSSLAIPVCRYFRLGQHVAWIEADPREKFPQTVQGPHTRPSQKAALMKSLSRWLADAKVAKGRLKNQDKSRWLCCPWPLAPSNSKVCLTPACPSSRHTSP